MAQRLEAALFSLQEVGMRVQIPAWQPPFFFFHRFFTLWLFTFYSYCWRLLASQDFLRKRISSSKLNPSLSIIFCLWAFLEVSQGYLFFLIFMLGVNHLTLQGGGGGWFWKKISCKRLSEEKNCMQHKCNRKLMGKKGEQISCSPDC